MSNWISVKDRLPSKDGKYTLFHLGNVVDDDIVAWQELPKPYKGDE